MMGNETGDKLVCVTTCHKVFGRSPMRVKRRLLPDTYIDPVSVDISRWPHLRVIEAVVDGPIVRRNGRLSRRRASVFFEGDPATWPGWLSQLAGDSNAGAMHAVEAVEPV